MPSLSHFLGPPLYRRYARKTVDFPPAHCSGGQPVINAATRWLIALVVLLLTGPAWAATTVTAGTDPTKFVMKGKIVTPDQIIDRSEEHTSELQSLTNLVCRLLLEKKKQVLWDALRRLLTANG